MPAPFTVYPEYDYTALCLYISKVSRSDVKLVIAKRQLRYLDAYLTSENIGVKSVVCEHEYVDRFYLSDYAEYFVKCFSDYPRKTSRIHFFSHSFSEEDFLEFLNKGDSSSGLAAKLRDHYIGFIVIRPIPDTFLAISCLKPFPGLIQGGNSSVLTKAVKVNLFGIDLVVRSMPYQEQDRVVAICATTALWSFFNAPIFSFGDIPSPSEITKNAIDNSNDVGRVFPSDGLSIGMIGSALSRKGLDPVVMSLHEFYRDAQQAKVDGIRGAPEDPEAAMYLHFMEHVYAYLACGLPIVLGASAFDPVDVDDAPSEDEQYSCAGRHAVTLVGYDFKENGASKLTAEVSYEEIRLKAHRISALYAHDDQLGPYAAIRFEKGRFCIQPRFRDLCGGDGSHDKEERNYYLDLSLWGDGALSEKRRYVPNEIFLGLPPKIRIAYERIKKTCTHMQRAMDAADKLISYISPGDDGGGVNGLFVSNKIEWDIRLFTVNDYKRQLLDSKRVIDREDLLSRSWPKYLWVATGFLDEDERVFDHIFDATDIDQGNVYLDTAYYDNKFQSFSESLIRPVLEKQLDSSIGGSAVYDNDANMRHYAMKLTERDSDVGRLLKELFGAAKPPAFIKDFEIVEGGIRRQENVIKHCFGVRDPRKPESLDAERKYIWAISEEGHLYVGEDQLVDPDNPESGYIGHPTLSAGMWARIAGELCFDSRHEKWVVNYASGRYCKYFSGIKFIHLRNARRLFETYFPGIGFIEDEDPDSCKRVNTQNPDNNENNGGPKKD